MATFEAARANGQFIFVGQVPDVCKTPPLGIPVPYPIVGFMSDDVSKSPDVRFRGAGAMTMASRVSRVIGNEAGAMGGVKSMVNMGFCKPISHSSTVRVNGQFLLYQTGTMAEMNCMGPDGSSNTLGVLTFSGPTFQAPKSDSSSGNPPVAAETPAEESFLSSIGGVDAIAGLASMAPQLATMDWSNPAGVLGALGGLAGLGGFGQVAQLAGYASQAAGIIQDPKSALGLLGPLGEMVGLPGGQLLKLASTDWHNPGGIMGAATNLAGMTGCFGQTKSDPESDLKVMH